MEQNLAKAFETAESVAEPKETEMLDQFKFSIEEESKIND